MLLTEFVVSIDWAYLIYLFSSGRWGKLRGKLLCCVTLSNVCHDLDQFFLL